MGRMKRYLGVGAAALSSAAVSALWALPAHACSCAQGSAKEAVDRGGTVVIVTRTDGTPNDANGRGGGLPVGTFRVEKFIGPEPPAELRGELDTGASCAPYVVPGALAALSAGRGTDGEWSVFGCGSGYPLGPALQLAEGDPAPERGGLAVAYAAGEFGGGRVAAIDERGAVVAWDRTPGTGLLVGTCPEGKSIVALARTERQIELTIHDATDLAVRRSVPLDVASGQPVLALRCLDRTGTRVDVVTTDRVDNDYIGRLVRVRSGQVTSVALPGVSEAQALSDGFIVRDRRTFSRLNSDGRLIPVASVDTGVERWLVSPDGRTMAAYSYLDPSTLVTLDVRSGDRLGERRGGDYVTGLAWTASGDLLVRESAKYRSHPNRVFAFDRTMTVQGEWPTVPGDWGGTFDAIGDAMIVYGSGTRLTSTPRVGAPVVANSFRTAAATHVVPASAGATFAFDPAATSEPSSETAEVTIADHSDTNLGAAALVGTLVGVGAAGLLGAAFAFRRRSG